MLRFVKQHSRVLAVIWAVVIFALCAAPGEYIPAVWWLELVSIDKLVHAGIFFLLYVLIRFSLGASPPEWLCTAWLIACILYGISLEFMQAGIFSNRNYDTGDMIANGVGAIIAFAAGKKYIGRLLANVQAGE